MRTELIQIPTDGIPMDGALHLPEGPVRGSVLYFHGNTMNFYTGGARFLPPYLTDLGLTVLAFNRRGHDILTTRLSRDAEGGAFQTVAESVADNQYAALWLAQQGHVNPVVIGHSYGGMLSTRFVADQPKTPALVLSRIWTGGLISECG
jgi:pimeloyl-ACP methyl ester carboxylesterase